MVHSLCAFRQGPLAVDWVIMLEAEFLKSFKAPLVFPPVPATLRIRPTVVQSKNHHRVWHKLSLCWTPDLKVPTASAAWSTAWHRNQRKRRTRARLALRSFHLHSQAQLQEAVLLFVQHHCSRLSGMKQQQLPEAEQVWRCRVCNDMSARESRQCEKCGYARVWAGKCA